MVLVEAVLAHFNLISSLSYVILVFKPCQNKILPTSCASSGFSDLSHTSREEPIRKTIELLVEAKPSANLGEVNLVRQLLQ